jgi:hypothetical protein
MALYAKLPSPIAPPEAHVVTPTHGAAEGAAAVLGAIKEGFLRPSDISAASIDEPALLHVPFWRIEVSVDGFHIGLSTLTANGRTLPLPTGGARHRDAVLTICARTVFPYEPKLPSFFGKLSGIPPLEIPKGELAPLRELPKDGEVLDADLDRDKAERVAVGMLLRAVRPSHAIYAKYEPEIRGAAFCLYPLYFARYRYEGEARRASGEDFFVAVSARTGGVISARHPSAARAVAAKVRRFLSFDRR